MRYSPFGSLVLLTFAAAHAQPDRLAPTADEQKTIDLVVKAGGKAVIDPKLPEAARVAASFDSATDAVLSGLKKAVKIGTLEIFDARRCTDKGFAALRELPELRKLILGRSEMSQACINAIGQCKQLRILYLGGSGLGDTELAGLKRLNLLESLDVSDNPRITDRGMESIQALERLRALNLAKTGITDKGLIQLKTLDGLRSLNVVGTKVTGEAADAFADEMPNLRSVRR